MVIISGSRADRSMILVSTYMFSGMIYLMKIVRSAQNGSAILKFKMAASSLANMVVMEAKLAIISGSRADRSMILVSTCMFSWMIYLIKIVRSVQDESAILKFKMAATTLAIWLLKKLNWLSLKVLGALGVLGQMEA